MSCKFLFPQKGQGLHLSLDHARFERSIFPLVKPGFGGQLAKDGLFDRALVRN
jgi:hypothetical protein